MFAKRFLATLRIGSVSERAEVVHCLGEVFGETEPGCDRREQVSIAMVAVLDDPSPIVRRALSEAVAHVDDLPRAVLYGLAADVASVAEPVLVNNSGLRDAWLINQIMQGNAVVGRCGAQRRRVSRDLSAAIAAYGEADACVVLVGNAGATISRQALTRMVERHGGNGQLRDVLLERSDLPLPLRRHLVGKVSSALNALLSERGWLNEARQGVLFADLGEQTAIMLAGPPDEAEAMAYATEMAQEDRITLSLVVRALIDNRALFAQAMIAVAADVPLNRARALLNDPSGRGVQALGQRLSWSGDESRALGVAFSVLHENGLGDALDVPSRRRILERLLTRYEDEFGPEIDQLMQLLARLHAEEVRAAVRDQVGAYVVAA